MYSEHAYWSAGTAWQETYSCQFCSSRDLIDTYFLNKDNNLRNPLPNINFPSFNLEYIVMAAGHPAAYFYWITAGLVGK